MAIPAKTIEEIKAKADIVGIIEKYLPTLKKAGRDWRARCPFHDEKTPSFYVSADKGFYHCFGCGATGDVFKFVQEYEKIPWPEAVRKIGETVGVAVRDDYENTPAAAENKKIHEALELVAAHYKKNLFETYAGKNALEYLKKRSVTLETVEKFGIGLSDGQTTRALAAKGVDEATLVKSGVLRISDGRSFEYMSGRVVFPIRDSRGRIVAFGGRSLDESRQPKYLNTPETQIYVKGRHLYGFYEGAERIKKSGEIIIVEGYMDVVVSHQEGLPNAVSCLGTALTEYHTNLINRFVKKAALMFDPDEAGLLAAVRASEHLINTDTEFFVISLPDKNDPDEYIIKNGAKSFVEYIRKNKKNFFDFHCEYLISKKGALGALDKLAVLKEIFPNVSKIKSPLLAQETLRIISEKIGADIHTIAAEYAVFSKNRRHAAVERPVASRPAQRSPSASERPLSREETLICFLVRRPEHSLRFSEEMFFEPRCMAVWKKIREAFSMTGGVEISSIYDTLSDDAKPWFSAITMKEIAGSSDECIEKIHGEMDAAVLRSRLKTLETEVREMLIKGSVDTVKYSEFNSILQRLKTPGHRGIPPDGNRGAD